jgi:hypothetical protein
MTLDLDSPPRHLERYAPPWARDRRTICGRPLGDVAVWVTFEEGRAIIAKHGQQRARLLLCQTCIGNQARIQSPSIWDTNPVQVVNDYTSHNWPNSLAFAQTRAELLAIAKLVAAHEAEFAATVTAYLTDELTARREKRA